MRVNLLKKEPRRGFLADNAAGIRTAVNDLRVGDTEDVEVRTSLGQHRDVQRGRLAGKVEPPDPRSDRTDRRIDPVEVDVAKRQRRLLRQRRQEKRHVLRRAAVDGQVLDVGEEVGDDAQVLVDVVDHVEGGDGVDGADAVEAARAVVGECRQQ